MKSGLFGKSGICVIFCFMDDIPSVIKRLFESRGISLDRIESFYSEELSFLPDLFSMKDLHRAAQRIIQGVRQGEKIGVFGDYDVDGTTACAFLYHFFKMFNTTVELMQPDRFTEGYGLHISSIDQAIEKGIRILITVDCGITSLKAASYARERGLILIITDHHKDALEHLPCAFAILNPRRRDEPLDSPLQSLAGVGVAFVLAYEVRKILKEKGESCPSLYSLLPFVAIGTICDMVELGSINRSLIRHGLRQLAMTSWPGLSILLTKEEKKEKIVRRERVSFYMGPLINSKGRMADPKKSLQLLISEDVDEAYDYYSHLVISNEERKKIQATVFDEAKKMILSGFDESLPASVVFAPHWHEGVIGIVAAKLVEEFRVPAVVFTQSREDKNILKASARSTKNVDLFSELKKCSHLFCKFGGHSAAAGISMPMENLDEFKKIFWDNLAGIPLSQRKEETEWDCEIFHQEINPTLLRYLERLEPFGPGNPRPVFLMRDMKLASYRILKDIHVHWRFSHPSHLVPLKGVSFNYMGSWGRTSPDNIQKASKEGKKLSGVFSLGINRYKGNEFIQLEVKDICVGLPTGFGDSANHSLQGQSTESQTG